MGGWRPAQRRRASAHASLGGAGRSAAGRRRDRSGRASAVAATATVGEISLTPNSGNLDAIGPNIPVFQGDASGNYVLSVPYDGVITSWSFLSAGAPTGSTFELRRLEATDASGSDWRALGTSAAEAVTSASGVDAVNGPFATSIPVSAGDRIALQAVSGSDDPIETGVIGEDGIRFFSAPLSDGSSSTIVSSADSGQVVPIQATETYTAATPSPTNTAAPTISGTPQAGQTLTCNPGAWTGAPTYSYSWSQSTSQLVPGAKPPKVVTATIAVASGQTYVVPDLAPDTVTISCTVTATNSAGAPKATTAGVVVTASVPVLAPGFTFPLARRNGATIVGNSGAGGTDTCSPGRWLHYPTTFDYKWYEKGYNAARHLSYATVIASGARLKVTRQIELHSIYCTVTASNSAGSGQATSASEFVPQVGPRYHGTARIQVEDPGPTRVPETSNAEPLQEGSDKLFQLHCLPPYFESGSKAPTYEWQVDLNGFFPVGSPYPSTELFQPDLTIPGPDLTITPETLPGADGTPGHDMTFNGGAPQASLGSSAPSIGEGEYGDLTIRCIVAAKYGRAETGVYSNVLYVLAIDGEA